ncbi:MAG: rhodanese-like domain-containing protein [Arenicellales bacterium]
MTFQSILSLFVIILLALNVIPAQADQSRLEQIQQRIEQNYPAVDHISAETFQVVSSSEDVVVFDVREQDEYTVSHLDNAIRVDPDISREAFDKLYGKSLSGKTVVFYCSVGRRSSELADRVGDDLIAHGSKDIFNLQHGIFGWHNNRMSLVDNSKDTDYVHPYNWLWGRLLERRDMIRYGMEN